MITLHAEHEDPAIAALLRDRNRIDEALRTMGYQDEQPPAADLPDGFYPLHDFGKAPEVEAVTEAKARLRKVPGTDPFTGDDLSKPSPTVDTEVPAEGTNVPKAPPVITDVSVREAWRGSSVNDREIMVGIKSITSGNIDKITEGTNAIFRKGMRDWTVRRAVYGSKTHTPAPGTLMQRGLVEQTDPHARGRIKYRLTLLGEAAVTYGGGGTFV